jgi:DNA-binding transcriptional LysR family regulator
MDSLCALNAFVRAAEVRSFTIAGRQLRVSSSAIGKAIARLEERHGVRLFHRNTRSLSLTQEGQLFLESCRRIMSEIEIVEKEFAQVKDTPKGRLRVSLPFLGGLAVATLSKFKSEYPDVELEIDIDDRFVDVIDAGYDVVVRAGNIEDSRLMTRRIASYRLELVASSSYLDRAGTPQRTDDLVKHTCLYLKDPVTGRIQPWPLSDRRFADTVFPIGAIANSIEALVAFATLGMGIACVPDFAVRQQLADGTLHRILDGCVGYEGSLKAIWPSNRYLSPKLRVFIDFMAKHGLSQVDAQLRSKSTQTPKRVSPMALSKVVPANSLSFG